MAAEFGLLFMLVGWFLIGLTPLESWARQSSIIRTLLLLLGTFATCLLWQHFAVIQVRSELGAKTMHKQGLLLKHTNAETGKPVYVNTATGAKVTSDEILTWLEKEF